MSKIQYSAVLACACILNYSNPRRHFVIRDSSQQIFVFVHKFLSLSLCRATSTTHSRRKSLTTKTYHFGEAARRQCTCIIITDYNVFEQERHKKSCLQLLTKLMCVVILLTCCTGETKKQNQRMRVRLYILYEGQGRPGQVETANFFQLCFILKHKPFKLSPSVLH